MNLRDFLFRREQELTEQITALHANLAPLETDLAIYKDAQAVVDRPTKQFAAGDRGCDDSLAEYANTPASTALRQFLAQHEENLTAQIAALRADLNPIEAELAEVRRAKGALGLFVTGFAPTVIVSAAGAAFATSGAAAVGEVVRNAPLLPIRGSGNVTLDDVTAGRPPSPYDHLTMKELVVKVLTEHFPNGATTRQMLDFFRDAWGRNIERQNLSPQISRLYQEGVIGRIRTTRGWFLYKKDGTTIGFRPYRHQGRILWCEPLSTDYQYEPLIAKDIEVEVASDRMPYKRTATKVSGGKTERQVRLAWLLSHEVQAGDEAQSPPLDGEEG